MIVPTTSVCDGVARVIHAQHPKSVSEIASTHGLRSCHVLAMWHERQPWTCHRASRRRRLRARIASASASHITAGSVERRDATVQPFG